MIEFQNLSFCYEENVMPSICDINLKILEGEFILLTGRSGCGKTTLCRMVNGLIPHFYSGEILGNVLLHGRSISSIDINDLSGIVGTVFQDPRSQFFMTETTGELAFGCENMGYSQSEILDRVSNTVAQLKLENLLNRSIFSLSSGQKQQVAIGSVYSLGSRIYVLDEPSANLDFQAIKKLTYILKQLKKCGCTILISEHRFYYLRDLIDRVVYMEDGKIEHILSAREFLNIDKCQRYDLGLRSVYFENLLEIQSDKKMSEDFKHKSFNFKVENISYFYNRRKLILKDISFNSNSGEVIGILGLNGTGKTTLVSLLSGLLKEKSGSIYYNNSAVKSSKRRSLSYFVMQDADYQLFGSSVWEELLIGVNEASQETITKVLESLGLENFKERHPASLSGGQKQRVTIGAALMKKSPILIFDEPTSGLDYESMGKVSELILRLSKEGRIIFLISHDFEFIIKTCTRILFLENGRIVQDKKLSPRVLKELSTLIFQK
ncbi:ABC transporter ATP-binding protein [Clostridium sporogenes]|uniref:ABC transporter ATP-binding protein n=1 Tax=Clostridium sporogenes TaxID=1509 RepID=UPI0013D453AF|nr:energy-coupling factor ABC transporter ATP-binding protein [Clostridium sporogenes]NFQ67897.1 energy-coupling factor ABC transporter ATP-binding protein [Clostridium sporogenes]